MPLISINPPFKRIQEYILAKSATLEILNIKTDLTWIDMLKGTAIIGIFYDNWLGYFLRHELVSTGQGPDYLLFTLFRMVVGPFVQVFFILSGFGLALGYLEHSSTDWSWKRWGWRRITKIVFPYYIFVILSFVLGMIGSILYKSVNVQFSWSSLIALFTFTQNFYSPSWIWNGPLWYMPVIIGLYAIFPFLLGILRKWGPVKLLLISILFTYTALIIAAIAGSIGDHARDIFLFWIFQFTLGILLAYVRVYDAEKLRFMIGYRAFLTGAAFISFSWILRTFIPYGKVFNDSITSVGIFLLLLNLGWGMRKIMPRVNNVFVSLSKQSFFMYLIHYPIIIFLIGPIIPTAMHPILVIILGGIFIMAIFYLCTLISKPISSFSSKLYSMKIGR